MFQELKALGVEARDSQERRQQSSCLSPGRQADAQRMKGWASWPFPLEQVGFAKYQQNTYSALAESTACG